MDELLSVTAAAARLGGISKWTIYAWLAQQKFGLTRIKVGSRTMIRASDLARIPQEGAKSPAPRRNEWR